jgi:hypothetical protein
MPSKALLVFHCIRYYILGYKKERLLGETKNRQTKKILYVPSERENRC